MTVTNTSMRVGYNGDDSTLTFAVPFQFLTSSNLRAYTKTSAGLETTKAIASYTGGSGSTGSVTFSTPAGSGTSLYIERVTPVTQETDYVSNDPFPAESHERALDKLTYIVQERDDTGDRSIVAPVSDDLTAFSLESQKPQIEQTGCSLLMLTAAQP